MRVSSVRQHGKLKGKRRDNLVARCLCTKCGREYNVSKDNLVRGLVTQCKLCNVKQGHETSLKKLWGGILPDELDRYLKTRWDAIKDRTEDPTNKHYNRYGGRGIRLSDEFQDPRIFVAYVKSLPNAEHAKDLQLDRIDNNKGYERGNLRWVTSRVNCNNRDMTIKISYKGKEIPISDFVRDYTDLSYAYVRTLVREGKTAAEIIELAKTMPNIEDRKKRWNSSTIFVEYSGERLSLRSFAQKHVRHMTYQHVRKLYNNGKTLDEIINWRKKSDVIIYKGEELHFKDFVSQHTKLSYVYARKLYRDGQSLDALAEWGR